jgi:hypothetical protein
MKAFSFRVGVALLTLVIGVSFASLRRNFLNGSSKIALSQERSNADISAWQLLLTFENQQLGELAQKSSIKLQQAIDTLLGKRENELFLKPQLFFKISNADGQLRYALIEESPLSVIPGESGIRIHLFNLEGKLLSSSAFSSGWRIALTGMRVRHYPEIGREVLEVGSYPSINGRDVVKQYYALIGEQVLLVRLESSTGRAIPNLYGAPNHTIGLTLVGRSASEWEKALNSHDAAEKLATLMWLGGVHLNPRNPAPDYSHEEMSEAKLADELRSSAGVKVAFEKLLKSKNAWVRRAAELALKAEYY